MDLTERTEGLLSSLVAGPGEGTGLGLGIGGMVEAGAGSLLWSDSSSSVLSNMESGKKTAHCHACDIECL